MEATTKSYQSGYEKRQGVGFSENTGADYVFPVSNTNPITVYDDDGLPHTIVLCGNDGLIYDMTGMNGPSGASLNREIKDKVDTSGENGTDITGEVELREDTGSQENYFLEHKISHLYVRPFDEDNRDASGHDSEGYLDDLEFDVYIYVDGKPVKESARAEDVDRDGDISFDRKLEGHRIHSVIKSNKADHIITGFRSIYKATDRLSGPDKTETEEMLAQTQYANSVLRIGIWSGTPLNKINGVSTTGDYSELITGPDTNSDSAFRFTGAEAMTASMTAALSGDCTIQFGLANITAPVDILKVGALTISITESGGVYTLSWADGVNTITQALNWANSGWLFVQIVRSDTSLIIREGYRT